jgi:hypothetical protein
VRRHGDAINAEPDGTGPSDMTEATTPVLTGRLHLGRLHTTGQLTRNCQ